MEHIWNDGLTARSTDPLQNVDVTPPLEPACWWAEDQRPPRDDRDAAEDLEALQAEYGG